MRRFGWVVLLMTAGGCGAFADISDPPGKPALLDIVPKIIFQGQYNSFTVSFIPPPPWAGQDGGVAYVVRVDFGEGINYRNLEYDGGDRVRTGLFAMPDAPTGLRDFQITLGFQQIGQPQKLYAGKGSLYVGSRQQPDGGRDGDGDGASDGGED